MRLTLSILLLGVAGQQRTSAQEDPLAAALRSIGFVNAGNVRATDSFERLSQCNGFTECYTQWDCAPPPGKSWDSGSLRDYLYDTTSGRQTATVPPVGMRSAMPLGGLGTGTFELRADGSFADWQVENQGPALATDKTQNSKLPLLEGALLGLRVGESLATTLRTHPPAGLPAAEGLSYSGAYPFARLGLNDSRVPRGISASVYAFSAMKLHDENASALPAVAFTLVLENSGSSPVNASFLLTLPLASTESTSRRTAATDDWVIKTIPGISAAACLKACGNTPNCSSWDLDLTGHPGTPAVPAVPAQVQPNHDLGCPNLGPGDTRKALDTIQECYSYCNSSKLTGCRGFVWDEISKEISGQCKGKPGQGCCIVKPACSKFIAKKGDTAVCYGIPAVPAVPAQPGPGCVLHSGAPAVQQYRTVRDWTSQTTDGWNKGASDASGVKGEWNTAGSGRLTHSRSNGVYNTESLMDPSAAVGEFTLLVKSGADQRVSVSSADSAAAVWEDFAADGILDGGVATHAGSGAVAAHAVVGAGMTRSITLVFSWRIPLRNYVSMRWSAGAAFALTFP